MDATSFGILLRHTYFLTLLQHRGYCAPDGACAPRWAVRTIPALLQIPTIQTPDAVPSLWLASKALQPGDDLECCIVSVLRRGQIVMAFRAMQSISERRSVDVQISMHVQFRIPFLSLIAGEGLSGRVELSKVAEVAGVELSVTGALPLRRQALQAAARCADKHPGGMDALLRHVLFVESIAVAVVIWRLSGSLLTLIH